MIAGRLSTTSGVLVFMCTNRSGNEDRPVLTGTIWSVTSCYFSILTCTNMLERRTPNKAN